jgi:hypothetical protein
MTLKSADPIRLLTEISSPAGEPAANVSASREISVLTIALATPADLQ